MLQPNARAMEELSGSSLNLLPVAAKIALHNAGGKPTLPLPRPLREARCFQPREPWLDGVLREYELQDNHQSSTGR